MRGCAPSRGLPSIRSASGRGRASRSSTTRDGREEQTETLKKTVRLGSNGELDITNITGNIEIKRGGGGDATIDVVKVARARTVEEAKELLPLVKVEINERGRIALKCGRSIRPISTS